MSVTFLLAAILQFCGGCEERSNPEPGDIRWQQTLFGSPPRFPLQCNLVDCAHALTTGIISFNSFLMIYHKLGDPHPAQVPIYIEWETGSEGTLRYLRVRCNS